MALLIFTPLLCYEKDMVKKNQELKNTIKVFPQSKVKTEVR